MEERKVRTAILCDKFGLKNIEVKNVEVGYGYNLIKPINIKDTSGETRDSISTVIFESEPTRGNQKSWGKQEEEDQIDSMIIDLTNLERVHIDEISIKDLNNISELIQLFLPEGSAKETES